MNEHHGLPGGGTRPAVVVQFHVGHKRHFTVVLCAYEERGKKDGRTRGREDTRTRGERGEEDGRTGGREGMGEDERGGGEVVVSTGRVWGVMVG